MHYYSLRELVRDLIGPFDQTDLTLGDVPHTTLE